jgi:LDH2 family malate/lactate/ureidoglycolate dehydrogenase
VRVFTAEELRGFAHALFRAAGFDEEKAETTARLLVLTDMMGRGTHGLAMLPLYLRDAQKGSLTVSGVPEIVKESGATAVWDAQYLPGLWVVDRAISVACERASEFGIAAIAIRKCHHIGCLAALSAGAAQAGYVLHITNSDPSGKRVAPFGGKEALFTPNPFSFSYPGAQNPVLIDTCASITTTSMTRQKVAEGKNFDHAWLLDVAGTPTRDPRVLEHSDPRGSIQLVGGAEAGHKGFGLTLMNEALSQGLSGHGRADAPTRWGGNVFVQVIDPAFFAGDAAFATQTDFLANACRANAPIDPNKPVRMPGDAAAAQRAFAEKNGVLFDEKTWDALVECARELGISVPNSMPD